MDFSELRERIEVLVKLGGWSNSSPSPDYAYLVNQGIRRFNRETQHNVEAVTVNTVADQEAYSLLAGDDRGWIAVFDDAIYGTSTWLPQTTRDTLRLNNRLWRTTAHSTPQFWFWAGPSTIGLYPIPSTSGTSIVFQGARHEPLLVDDTDECLIDEEFLEGPCLYGAWHWGKLFTRGEERDIAKEYELEASIIAGRCIEAYASKEAGSIVRRVARPPQEYLGIGGKQRPVYWP